MNTDSRPPGASMDCGGKSARHRFSPSSCRTSAFLLSRLSVFMVPRRLWSQIYLWLKIGPRISFVVVYRILVDSPDIRFHLFAESHPCI